MGSSTQGNKESWIQRGKRLNIKYSKFLLLLQAEQEEKQCFSLFSLSFVHLTSLEQMMNGKNMSVDV